MKYEQWRDELFNHPPDTDPVWLDLAVEFYDLPAQQAFDYIDRILVDPTVHSLFSKEQLGTGLNFIYSNSCSDFPFLYTKECEEERRITGIKNLDKLYRNFFERYCTAPLVSIGNSQVADGSMGFICYMFWDIFVLYPGNATPEMISAGVNVMRKALDSHNDNCLVSAIHGLGHWAFDVPEAVIVLEQWLDNPTTDNPEIRQYAKQATTGMIL